MQAPLAAALSCWGAEKAEATVDSDREEIFALVRRGEGFAHFNRTIRLALRHSFERVAVAHVTSPRRL